jgi:hypothetical protein
LVQVPLLHWSPVGQLPQLTLPPHPSEACPQFCVPHAPFVPVAGFGVQHALL